MTTPERPVDIVTDYVLSQLKDGLLAPGQRITEQDIITTCNVGTGPTREALRILSGEGVIEIVPNKGARVLHLDRKELLDILHVMRGILAKGIQLAAGKLENAANRERLNARLHDIRELAKSGKSFSFMHSISEYHRTLNEITGNIYLNYLFSPALLIHFNRELSSIMRLYDWEKYLLFYEDINNHIIFSEIDQAMEKFLSYMNDLIGKLRN